MAANACPLPGNDKVGYTRDWRKNAQKHSARDERLYSLGQRTSGIIHDLNNVLHSLRLRLALIERSSDLKRNVLEMKRQLDDAAHRLHALHSFVKGRLTTGNEIIDLEQVVQDSIEMVRAEAAERSRFLPSPIYINNLMPTLPHISGSASELKSVIANLIINSFDAMPEGGTIELRGTAIDGKVSVTVTDDGIGIDAALLPRIFEAFFTTKGAAGMGLGLSMAREIMHDMGAEIEAKNRPGHGAVFTLSFTARRGSDSGA